jgi:hypothetical protein
MTESACLFQDLEISIHLRFLFGLSLRRHVSSAIFFPMYSANNPFIGNSPGLSSSMMRLWESRLAANATRQNANRAYQGASK